MYYVKSVRRFLNERETPSDLMEAIELRMNQASEDGSTFSAGALDEVMGDEVLAQSYRDAYENDPAIHAQE